MTKPKSPPKPPKIKRAARRSGRGRVMAFYARPETEQAIRDKSRDEGKAIGVVIAEAVMGADK